MDGSDQILIAEQLVYWPNDLTIDYAANQLYWIDARYHVVESSQLDGSRRHMLYDQGKLLIDVL